MANTAFQRNCGPGWMRISALEGARVALWGFGREGRAAWRVLRERHPQQPLTVFCPAAERAAVASLGDPLLQVAGDPDAAQLAAFDCVIKSPGISPYTPLAREASALGARFSSGTALWFGEALPGLKLAITGTKGKSTTSALIAHLLRRGGRRVALAGNIGLPLLELAAPAEPPEVWVIELSSYQTADARQPDVALVLNLFPEHLDWHGSEAQYIDDKLALIERAEPRRVVLNARDPRLFARGRERADVRWFDHPDGWQLRDDWVFRGDEPIVDGRTLPLPGQHNRVNLCAALAAIEALDIDPRPLARHAADFRALPHRLQSLGCRDGIEYVDDSISTTPHASLAALDCHHGRRVAIIVGGFDRGLDWNVFAERIDRLAPVAVIATGQNGPRIAELLRARGSRVDVVAAADLPAAVAAGQAALAGDGVLLLSPGAPSFPLFRDYAERGRAFAAAAGFPPAASDMITGLGIA
jgi:UDP-N-acetylmuramoyl-L-alanine---L-glutamate ligase